MRGKILIFTVLMLMIGTALMGQSITLLGFGIKKASGQGDIDPGDEIEILYRFTLRDFDEDDDEINGTAIPASAANINRVFVYWHEEDGTSLSYSAVSGVREFDAPLQWTNDVTNEKTTKITLPTPPQNAAKFRIRSAIYGSFLGEPSYFSSLQYSSDIDTDYTEFLHINTNQAPVARNVIIENPQFAKLGQELNAIFDYEDADGDQPGTHIYQWYSSDTANGTYSMIAGATGLNYTVQSDDVGKYLKFGVTPVATSGTSPGIRVMSSNHSALVTGAPRIYSVNVSSGGKLHEAITNDGSMDCNEYVIVTINNATFKNDLSLNEVRLTGLPEGIVVCELERNAVNASQMFIKLTGYADEHEYAAFTDATTPVQISGGEACMEGVSDNLVYDRGFMVEFKNNPPEELSVEEVTYNSVKIEWDTPAGLLAGAASGLSHFVIFRDDVNIGTAPYREYRGSHSYTDNTAITGISQHYEVEAIYDKGGLNARSANRVFATPQGFASFAILGTNGIIDHQSKTVTLSLPANTSLENLVATFSAPGSSTVRVGLIDQVSGTTPNDFSKPVAYRLQADDGSSTTYTVSVLRALAVPVLISEAPNPTTSSINVAWEAVAGATGYILDLAKDENFNQFVEEYEAKPFAHDITRVVINNIPADTDYYFRIKATAADASLNSAYSAVGSLSTLATPDGAGNTELNETADIIVNMGTLDTGGQGTIYPSLHIVPTGFNANANDKIVNIELTYGSKPYGMIYTITFDDDVMNGADFTFQYNGLSYHPTEVRLNGVIIPNVVNTASSNITISWSSRGAKGPVELLVECNDESEQTLPVVLSTFTAHAMVQGRVRLNWTTQSESGVLGFHALRGDVDDIANSTIVSPLIEASNTSTTTSYSFIDDELPGNGIYYYWLQITDINGEIEHFGPITLELTTGEDMNNQVPLVTALKSPYPNPFNPTVTIPYDLAENALVKIKIYNTRGQLIKTLVDKEESAKSHSVIWNGKDESGKHVSTGNYIIKMNVGKYQGTKRVVLLK